MRYEETVLGLARFAVVHFNLRFTSLLTCSTLRRNMSFRRRFTSSAEALAAPSTDPFGLAAHDAPADREAGTRTARKRGGQKGGEGAFFI